MIKYLYVMGTSHSGSTLLAFLLNTHPDITSIGETSPSLKRNKDRHLLPCSCGELIGECPFWNKVFDEVTSQGVTWTPRQWAMMFQDNKLLRNWFYRSHAHPVKEGLRRMFMPILGPHNRRMGQQNVMGANAILNASGKSIFADASKSANRLELLLKVPDFDVRIIWLVRDVRAFVSSLRRRGFDLEGSAERWRKTLQVMERVYERAPFDNKMILKYEDLTANPKKVMNEVFDFAGVEQFEIPEDYKAPEHHIIGHKSRLNPARPIVNIEKWREKLTPEEQELAIRIGGPKMEEFGYI